MPRSIERAKARRTILEGIGDRLTGFVGHARKRFAIDVELDKVDAGGTDTCDPHAPLLQRGDVASRDGVCHVDLPGTQCSHPRGRVLDHAERYSLPGGLAAPIVVVADKFQLFAGAPALEPVWSRAVRCLARIEILGGLEAAGRPVHDKDRRKEEGQVGNRTVRLDDDGEGIGDGDRLDAAHIGAEAAAGRLEEIPDPLDRIDDIVRVKGRSVMKTHIVLELELPSGVGQEPPGGRKTRLQREVLVLVDQTLKDMREQ